MAGPCAGAEKSYTDHVTDALAYLQVGKTRESVACLGQSLAVNANDPLAHVVLGLAFLMGGRQSDAQGEFQTASAMDKSCAEAIYGRALVCLQRKQIPEATALFCQAKSTNQALDVEGAVRYAKFLAGANGTQVDSASDDECVLALSAFAMAKNGKQREALDVLKRLQPKAARPGFGERIGCTASFQTAKPLIATGWPLEANSKPAAAKRDKLQTVSGRVALRADLSRAQTVAMVSFFVDGRLVGVTNRSPFDYTWDTTEVANGVHTVKITGTDSSGAAVSEKTAQVAVRNAGSKGECDRVTGPEADAAWKKLWSLLELKPSASAINYNLALCASREGDRETAIAALERVMASDPDYLDTAKRLAELYGRAKPTGALHGVQAAGKTIALSFDDGPKPDTAKLLDVLKQKGVKATFFVVGKQVDAYPDLLKRMAAEGHDIQNHTYGHRALEYLSTRDIEQEYFACAATIRSVLGTGTAFMRPPGAHHGPRMHEVMQRFGVRTVFWTVACSGLEGTTKEKMRNYVVSSAKPGAIILMHNLERVTLNALPSIIDALRSKGYSFATLSEMTRQGAEARARGGKNGQPMEDKLVGQSKS